MIDEVGALTEEVRSARAHRVQLDRELAQVEHARRNALHSLELARQELDEVRASLELEKCAHDKTRRLLREYLLAPPPR